MTPERCSACGRKKARSNPANARYWLVLHVIADKVKPNGQTYSPEIWHTWAKSRFLGCEEITMPNGKAIQIPHSSANLSTEEFAEFALKVEQFGIERGAYLEELPT